MNNSIINVEGKFTTYYCNPGQIEHMTNYMVRCAYENKINISFRWGVAASGNHYVELSGKKDGIKAWLRKVMGMDRSDDAIEENNWSKGYSGCRPLGKDLWC